MAEPAPLSKEELSKNFVQEIAKNGDQIPEKYIHKDGFPEAIDAPHLWRDPLLIDFSLLSSSAPAARLELDKLRSALSDWGCFMVINHGMEASFLEGLIDVGKQFFSLPLEEKLQPPSGAEDGFQGYGSEPVYAGSQTVNWTDRLFLPLYPEEKRKLQFWPQKPEKFRGMVVEYANKLAMLVEGIYKGMARSLDLEEDCFFKHIGKKALITGRFGMYPRCPHPERILGIKPHSDGATLTVLLPDKEVEGLQVEKDGQWFKVPITPGALFVNLGDIGEVMTNGVFKSAIHRVVTNADKDRVSLAAFSTPLDVDQIGPVSELVGDQRPQRYKKFNMSEFLRIYFENYAQGRRTPDALKV